jgi:hypothetical protein
LRTTPHERLGWEVALTIETLGRLAELGNPNVVPVLRGYASYGVQWDHALQRLAELNDPHAVDGLAYTICSRFVTGKQLDDSLTYDLYATNAIRKLWLEWAATHPCIEKLISEVNEIEVSRARAHPRPTQPDYEALSVRELLAASGRQGFINVEVAEQVEKKVQLADKVILVDTLSQDNPFAWYVALRGLQVLGLAEPFYQRILDQAVSRIENLPEGTRLHVKQRRATVLTLLLLPAEMTLPVARSWFTSLNWHEESVAEDILEQHATMDDFWIVRSALTKHLAAEPANLDSYRTCSLLDILACLPDTGVIPEVERVFLEAAYSRARIRAARAMQVEDSEWFARTYAYECLWDCEEETRQVGCESVSLETPGARQRLQALSDDQHEYESVRLAAAHRLGKR